MNANCPNCDRPECNKEELQKSVKIAERHGGRAFQNAHDAHSNAQRRCNANSVDWRARALAAEARIDAAADVASRHVGQSKSEHLVLAAVAIAADAVAQQVLVALGRTPPSSKPHS